MNKVTKEFQNKRIIVSSSNNYTENGPMFPVANSEFIDTRISYIGIKGKKYSSYIALIWIKNGQEFSREHHWIIFNNKKNSVKIFDKIPKNADECLIGLRINCETPEKGDTELLIDDINDVKIQNKRKITNIYQYFFSIIRRELLPDARIRDKIQSKTKLFNYILVKIQSSYLKNSFVLGYPYMAFIDPSNRCNYKCPLCPTGRLDKKRNRSIMKFQDFKTIMNQIGKYIYKLHLYNWGEPFLNKNLVKMIRYAKKFNIIVEGSTNLSILNENLVKDIIASDLDYLIVAIDGITNESYSKYRVGGNLKNVLNNLNLLLDIKKQLSSHKPDITISFLPTRYNENDIPKAIELFKQSDVSFTVGKLRLDMCDEVMKTKNNITQFTDWLPLNPDLSIYDKNLNKSLSDYCNWPWEIICIHPDGNVSPCCAIYSQKYDFGNILKSSFYNVWNSKKYRSARATIRKNKINNDSNMPCNYCIKQGGFLDYQPNIHGNVS